MSFNLSNNIILAPLAGITDYIFRDLINNFFDIGLTTTEMISVEGILYKNKKTLLMLDDEDIRKKKVSVQLFGNNPERILKAALIVQERSQPYNIDINMGCPVKKIVRQGSGAALLKDLKKIEEIIRLLKKNLKTNLTIKIRSGWSNNELNYIKIGEIADYYNISAITLHARTAVQFYSGVPEYTHIQRLKEHIKIPIIANGNIFSLTDYNEIKNLTKSDYYMLGRGILYNPYLINEILLNKKTDKLKNKKIALYHLNKLIEYYGENLGVKKFRKHFSWYFKGFRNISKLRSICFKLTKQKEIIDLINNEVFL